jgi:hypothetical protein
MIGEVSWDPKEDECGPLGIQSSLVYLEDFPTAVTMEKSTNDTEMGIRGWGFTKHSKD